MQEPGSDGEAEPCPWKSPFLRHDGLHPCFLTCFGCFVPMERGEQKGEPGVGDDRTAEASARPRRGVGGVQGPTPKQSLCWQPRQSSQVQGPTDTLPWD